MRKQTRPPEPGVLAKHGTRWNRQWRNLRVRNPQAPFQWYRTDNRSAREWILPDLREMTQGHCAFCDAFPLEDRSTEPIEHFRPKSDPRFYNQAYAWKNLYYCCERCQSNKGEQWDDRLLRPDATDYSFTEYFDFNFRTGMIQPNATAERADQLRAEVTIDLYGLDSDARRRYRKLERRRWRRDRSAINNWAYRDFLQ